MKARKLAGSSVFQGILARLPHVRGVELDHVARAVAARMKEERLGLPVEPQRDGAD